MQVDEYHKDESDVKSGRRLGRRARSTVRREHVVRRDRWRDVNLELWNLYTYSAAVAKLALPPLLNHVVPDVRAGALYGLIEIREVVRHLQVFRQACRHRDSIVRDAGIWGLSQSRHLVDENTLWKAVWKDPVLEIQFSAAYSLRVMPRSIASDRYERTIRTHPVYGVRLELAERGISDSRLRTIAKQATSELLPELKRMRLLTPETREVLARLAVFGSASPRGM